MNKAEAAALVAAFDLADDNIEVSLLVFRPASDMRTVQENRQRGGIFDDRRTRRLSLIASRRFSAAPWSSAIPGPVVAAMVTASMSSTTTMSSTPCDANRFAKGEPPVRQALWSSIYRDSLFPRTEYAEAWNVLQRDLPRREACRRMVELLFIAHEQACEAELAHLLAADLYAGQVPDTKALASRLAPRLMTLPKDVAVTHPSLASFDALLGASA